MRPGTILLGLLTTMAVGGLAQRAVAADQRSKTGVVEFVPVGDESALPEQFRLERHTFRYRQSPLPTLGKVMTVWKLTFPSPLVTPHPNNNHKKNDSLPCQTEHLYPLNINTQCPSDYGIPANSETALIKNQVARSSLRAL